MKHKQLVKKIINGALFYLGWGWCIKDALTSEFPIQGPLIVAAILVIDLLIKSNRLSELIIIVIVTLGGTFIDTAFQLAGLIQYKGFYPGYPWIAPLWISSLWALYATSLNGSLSWLRASKWLAIVFGAIGGPFCYLFAIRLGAAEVLVYLPLYLAILGATWAFILPFTLYLAQFIASAIKAKAHS